MGRWGVGRLLIVMSSLVVMGCATWSRWLPEAVQGYAPVVQVRPMAQVIWTNEPYNRYAVLTSLLSRVIPERWLSLHVVVGDASCGLCANGPVIYVDPGVFTRYSDQEVLFGLAHELAHGALGHLDNTVMPVQPPMPVGGEPPLAQDSPPPEPILSAHFSRMQERAADRQAVAYVNALGYDGQELRRNYHARVDEWEESVRTSWLARHPIDTDATPMILRPFTRLPALASALGGPGAASARQPSGEPQATAPPSVPGRRLVSRLQSPLAPPVPTNVLPDSFDVDLRITGQLVQINETDDGWLQILVKDILSERVPVVITTATKIRHGYRLTTMEDLRENAEVNVTYHFDALTDRRYASTIEVP